MPPPCSICSEEMTEQTVYVCKREHAVAGPKIGNATQSCPLAKGAIWVHVAGEGGKGVGTIPVTNPGSGPGKATDDKGFAPFDPLDEGTSYSVTIGPLPTALEPKYYLPDIVSAAGIPVSKGQITSVEFQLVSAAELKVIVKESGKEAFVKGIDVTVTAPSPETAVDPAKQTTPENGVVTYKRLRKAAGYKVKIELSPTDAKKFKIIDKDTQTCDIDPDGKNELTFELEAITWVKIHIRDKEADAIADLDKRKLAQPSGAVKLKLLDETFDQKPLTGTDPLEFVMKHKTGTNSQVDSIVLDGDEYYEFVTVSESD